MRAFLVLTMSASLFFGCSDASQSPSTTLTATTLTDLRNFDPETWTLEYSLDCQEGGNADQTQLGGELAPVGPGPVNGAPGYSWNGTPGPPPGPCEAYLRLRDADGEVICSEWKEFVVAADAPTEVDIFMGCETF